MIFANFCQQPAERVATRLSALTGLKRLFFSDNGSTAVEVALKIAWQRWWREVAALGQLEQALQIPSAAVILEALMQGASGMRVVRPAFLRAVAERVEAAGALLIAAEVMSGFGRCGDLFACRWA